MNKAEFLKFYSEKGWQSFPCVARNKTPLVKWADVATTEIDTLVGWLEQWPDMNIGIATGERSGIFVLDVDADHNGFESLDTLEKKFGKLPKTPTVITGGGGRHYFFKHPKIKLRNVQNSGKLGKGLDIRGDGGYVVAAGSVHPNGNIYTWDKNSPPSQTLLADAPDWMLKMLIAEQSTQAHQQIVDNSAIPNGGRNNTLASLAGAMKRKGVGLDAIYSALLIENKQKCIPPLSDYEVKNIAESIMRYDAHVSYTQNRDRLQTEWSFATAIFQFPLNAVDFQEVVPEMFQDHTLSDFWQGVKNNEDVTDSAIKAGILTELERYRDYDVSRLDGYARSIRRFAYLADVEKKADTLKRQAHDANDAGIEKAVNDINKIPSQIATRIVSIGTVADEVEAMIRERTRNPAKVWGIHYAWRYLSILTGGKQKGELTLCAAEPKIGKSWWWLQDALFTAVGNSDENIPETPVFYWCGEMKRHQLMRRFYQLLGVNGRRMKEGSMTPDDWGVLEDAKAIILNSPLYIDDNPLMLHEVRPLLVKQKVEHGIEQAVFDYSKLIKSPGINEIEQTENVSLELKRICQELDLAITLIASVNKMGMDSKSETVSKSNVRGSGQQIHDADNIFIFTKFNKEFGMDYGLRVSEYDSVKLMHLTAGRELEHNLENGFIPYQQNGSPKFTELKRIGGDK